MRRLLGLVAVSAVMLVISSSALIDRGAGERSLDPAITPGTRLAGHGLQVRLPRGWAGRIDRPSPVYAIMLEAATAPLRQPGQTIASNRLKRGDIYLAVVDIGPPSRGIERDEDWDVSPPLPLAITTEDVDGPYKGGFRAGASLNAVINNRALMILVRFGSQPSKLQLGEVNAVLASLAVSPLPQSVAAANYP